MVSIGIQPESNTRILRQSRSRDPCQFGEGGSKIRRSTDRSPIRILIPGDDPVANLLAELRRGVAALNDPEIEARVQNYFERHPNYSCDLILVAEVAIRFQTVKQRSTETTPRISSATCSQTI